MNPIVLLIPLLVQATDPVAEYLGDLEKAGVVRTDAGTLETLRAGLVAAEQDLVTGNVQTATARLFALVESGAFAKFTGDPEYQNAELTLGRALVRGGAYGAAERYLGRVLRRGPKQPFFAAAYRAMVDVALETREEAAVLARLDAMAGAGDLPKDSANEHAYLGGKVMYTAGQFAAAARQLDGGRPAVAVLCVGSVFSGPRRRARAALRQRPPQSVRDRRASRQ